MKILSMFVIMKIQPLFRALTSILFLMSSLHLMAQPIKKLTKENSYKWMFGIGWNAMDDDGNAGAFYSPENWHYNAYPSRIFADRYIYNGWSCELSTAFNQYNPNKLVNGQLGKTGIFLATDANLKYSFYKLLKSGTIDPYVSAGFGLSMRTKDDSLVKPTTPTLNVLVGCNFWFSKTFGLQIQSGGKLGLTTPFMGKSNYMQHSIGLVVRFETLASQRSDFSKKHHHINKGRTKIKIPKEKKEKEG